MAIRALGGSLTESELQQLVKDVGQSSRFTSFPLLLAFLLWQFASVSLKLQNRGFHEAATWIGAAAGYFRSTV